MRIVLDSNILVRAFVSSHGVASDLLLTILSGGHTLIRSNEMLSEVARVLRYPRLMAIHGENEETIYEFTAWLHDVAEIVALDLLARAPIRDRNDIFVLQTVLAARRMCFAPVTATFLSRPPRSSWQAAASIFSRMCS